MKNLDDYQSISITNNKFEQELSVFFYYHKTLKYIFSLYLLPASIRMKIVNFIISLYSILNEGRIFYNRAVTQNNISLLLSHNSQQSDHNNGLVFFNVLQWNSLLQHCSSFS